MGNGSGNRDVPQGHAVPPPSLIPPRDYDTGPTEGQAPESRIQVPSLQPTSGEPFFPVTGEDEPQARSWGAALLLLNSEAAGAPGDGSDSFAAQSSLQNIPRKPNHRRVSACQSLRSPVAPSLIRILFIARFKLTSFSLGLGSRN